MKKLKPWLPTIVLLALMLLLIAAARVYIGGPDGVEIVWKGELSFNDTVVNLSDYTGIPKTEFAKNCKNHMLVSQMEEMGLFDDEPRFKHRIKKNPWLRSSGKNEDGTEAKNGTTGQDGHDSPDKDDASEPAKDKDSSPLNRKEAGTDKESGADPGKSSPKLSDAEQEAEITKNED